MSDTASVLVTGAAGYIGSRVTKLLLDASHDVRAIDDFSEGTIRRIGDETVEEHDVRADDVGEMVAEADAVMHLAAVSGVQDCDEHQRRAYDVNVRGTDDVAWHCREHETPLVFPCSMATLGDPVETPITADHPRDPVNFYGVTKAMSEEDVGWLADGAFPAHVFLKSNLYGHHTVGDRTIGKSTVINIFVEKALSGEPLTVHEPGTQARDFVHVKDVARAYLLSLDSLLDTGSTGSKTFPIAGGDCRSILEIGEVVQRIVREERGIDVPIEMVENPRENEAVGADFTVDTSAAEETIGFEAEYTVERAVREMVS